VSDIKSKEARSYNMRQIKNKNTKPEMLVRRWLFSHGYRYRLHAKNLPGKPDIVLPKYKTVILVNGCFWHGHERCKYFVWPQTNTEFWHEKISKTMERDRKLQKELLDLGWHVVVIWECQVTEMVKQDPKKVILSLD